MCSAALVEPPVAATAAQTFSRLLRVTRSRGSGPPVRRISITRRPARRASAKRSLYTAGIVADPRNERPSASPAIAMVLAVNWPGQEPTVIAQVRSMPPSCASVMSPFW